MGSMLSGLFGGGSSPGQQQQQQALKASREDIQRYRPEAMQARLNALANMTSGYQGANNALETLWGDPNGQPSPPVGGGPQRMLGHDMPQFGRPAGDGSVTQGQPQPRHSALMQGVSTIMDPLNIFRGR